VVTIILLHYKGLTPNVLLS